MARPATLKVEVITDAKRAADGIQSIDSKFGAIGKAAKFAGAALAGAAIGQKVLDFAKDSISAASDVQQAFGAVESVFGRNAKTIQRWAKTADKAYGLSTAEAAQMAAVTGAQLQGLGFDLAKSTQLTQDLTARAADMAATFGGTTAQALEAVGSLLRGERDPIEKYGVSIKQTAINAELAAKGQQKLTGAARTQAEAQAALRILFDKTATSAGAFARESDTLAGQQQRAAAQVQNLKAAIGSALLPVLTQLFAWVNTKVIPALQQLWTWIQTKLVPAIKTNLTPVLKVLQGAWANLTKASRDTMAAFEALGVDSKMLKTILAAMAVGVIIPLVTTIVALAKAIQVAAAVFRGMAEDIRRVVNAVKDLVSWLGRIKVPKISLPDINPFSRSAPAARTTSLVPLARSSRLGGATARAATSSGPTIIINGALDPEGVARQIRRYLQGHSVRVGSAAAQVI